MTRRNLDLLIAFVYALLCFLVVLAPALAVRWATTIDSTMTNPPGSDLVAASSLIGGGHALVAWTRMRSEERTAVRRIDMWIAALNALVVLALGATVLLIVVLYPFAEEHAWMANRGYPVVALWTGVQLVAVLLAEAVGRLVFWWLEPHGQPHPHCRWRVMPPLRRSSLRRTLDPEGSEEERPDARQATRTTTAGAKVDRHTRTRRATHSES